MFGVKYGLDTLLTGLISFSCKWWYSPLYVEQFKTKWLMLHHGVIVKILVHFLMVHKNENLFHMTAVFMVHFVLSATRGSVHCIETCCRLIVLYILSSWHKKMCFNCNYSITLSCFYKVQTEWLQVKWYNDYCIVSFLCKYILKRSIN